MKCPHCKKEIEDRWLYPIGQKLFKRGLHNSFKNIEILGHSLSIEGFPIYLVRELYQLNAGDSGVKIEYLASHRDLHPYIKVDAPQVVVSKSEWEQRI